MICAILTACSSSKRNLPNVSAGSGPPQSTTTTSTTVPQDGNGIADYAKAESLLLVASDVPAAWSDDPPQQQSAQDQQFQTQTNSCLGEPSQDQLTDGEADGDVFSSGNNIITSTADIYKTSDLAQQDQTKSSDSKNWDCVSQVIVASVKAGYTASDPEAVVSASIQPLDHVTSGQNQLAIRQIATIKSSVLGNHTIYNDTLGYVSGRIGVSANIRFIDQAPSNAVDQAYMSKLLAHGQSQNKAA
jgi:hypothetical protein